MTQIAGQRGGRSVAAKRSVVVFSGVESLLIDRLATTFEHAATVVDLLERRGVPLVLCSGRTRAELEYVQQRLGIVHPFICEHGAAACAPLDYFGTDDLLAGRTVAGCRALEFGRPYRDVVEALHRLAARVRVGIVSFSEMSVHEVAEDAGVPLLQAQLAKLRDYEEPFRLLSHDVAGRGRLRRALQTVNIGCVSDGRYDYAGAPVDVGIGVQWLTALYRRAHGAVVTVGIGDKLHHRSLLCRVDVPVIIDRGDAVTRELSSAVRRATLCNIDGDSGALADLIAALLENPAPLGAAC